jgi:precorrin-4/cobalt-precorrin-4 C11-methyltransferase
MSGKVYFVGAGPGDPELITVRGCSLLKSADVILYTGSLIPPEILKYARQDAILHNSAEMVLEEIIDRMVTAARAGQTVIRLHSGDPCIYGTLSEQIQELEQQNIEYEVVPGVSSAFAAAAALKAELTVPEISQTVIFTRIEGKTKMPDEETLAKLASHHATLVIFLSTQYIDRVVAELCKEYPIDTPVAVVQKASWPDQKVIRGTLANIIQRVKEAKIVWTALIIVGEVLREGTEKPKSRLYDKGFAHGYREAKRGKD